MSSDGSTPIVLGASGAAKPTSTDDAYVITGTDSALAVRLINFKTGSYELLPTHEQWLKTWLPPVLKGRTGVWFDVLGFTSRSGTVSYNLTLSQQRVGYVAGYLAQYLPADQMNVIAGFGESGSWHDDENAGYDRAVEVYVFGYKAQPGTSTSVLVRPLWRTFRVRMVVATSALLAKIDKFNSGITVNGVLLEFEDVGRKRRAYFTYSGVGLALPNLSLPLEGPGPWTSFKLYGFGKETLESFEGSASLYQAPGLSSSLTSDSIGGEYYLAIDSSTLVNNGTLRKPRLICLQGGEGIGVSLGMVSQGALTLIA